MKTVDFFYFCGSYSYMCIESRNQEQSQKNKNMKKLFYIWNRLYDGRVQDTVLFTWGPRRKKNRWHYGKLCDSKKN